MSNKKIVEIYYCEFRRQQQFFSRHYISDFSVCRIVDVKNIDEIYDLFPKDLYKQLLENNEVDVFDKNIINKITSLKAGEGGYLRLVCKNV